MSDHERVLSLLEEGKLTREEADRLLAALGDIAEVEGGVEDLEASLASDPPSSDPNPSAAEPPRRLSPTNLPWVRIDLLAGDIDISVDSSLTEPVVDGQAEVIREGQDFVIKPVAEMNGDGIPNLITKMIGKFGDLDVKVPAGYGVDIHSKAGDVDVEGVAFLKGNLLAGDIDARNIGGVDLSLSAGDVDVSMRPTAGEHRISATAGDVDVTLLGGSSVEVTGSVSMGDVDAKGFTVERKKSMMGGGFSGRIGDGTASLEIQLSAGDLDVVVSE